MITPILGQGSVKCLLFDVNTIHMFDCKYCLLKCLLHLVEVLPVFSVQKLVDCPNRYWLVVVNFSATAVPIKWIPLTDVIKIIGSQ